MRGSSPRGARSEEEAAAWVRGMFGRVAPRYDLVNHLLSMNIDRWWRAHTVRRLKRVMEQPGARVLDICCGTGDLAFALMERSPGRVFASDFCHPMLVSAREKAERRNMPARLFEADALRLPLANHSLDLLTVAFGFRNLANYDAGLKEMARVLKPGGTAAILEFSQPTNPFFAAIYGFYSRHVLPRIGGAITGSRDAYTYLPESVRKFPTAGELKERMKAAGFEEVCVERLTGGIVALHTGVAQT